MLKSKKGRIIFIVSAVFVVLAAVFIGWFFHYKKNSSLSVIGVVSDIHAANDKKRTVDGSAYGFPRKYKEYFPFALSEMKKQGVSVVLALGDNTNVGKSHYAKNLIQIAKDAQMDVIWVKGNHDTRDSGVMKYFGVDQTYYLRDFKNWRIIVLDSTVIDPNGVGGLDEAQLNWLKESLKTDKNVIIAMHHPIWERTDDGTQVTDTIYPIYSEFEKIIAQSGNVRYVFSGHYHIPDWVRTYNGIEYHIVPSLTGNENVAQFKIIRL